ncbi:hypothetical protein GCM10010124_35380 [Pilimelia terevasa]|uniref:Uncharacterized protein n=1 Tax=Pilimelia terevasa TaxID=53372 RepID=A0A8J3BVL3_9ACTN|nr:hypothetical protein [Pilimelia terevasa]GGK39648.1 hypothetical protein GCM10010124_35380 [Pilimelia terevasa]
MSSSPGAELPAALTNRQDHPVHDNRSSRTVGACGPATSEDYQS